VLDIIQVPRALGKLVHRNQGGDGHETHGKARCDLPSMAASYSASKSNGSETNQWGLSWSGPYLIGADYKVKA
jgi:hypothetical protein